MSWLTRWRGRRWIPVVLCLTLPAGLGRLLAEQAELRRAVWRRRLYRRLVVGLGLVGLVWTWAGLGMTDDVVGRIGVLLVALSATAAALERAVGLGDQGRLDGQLERLVALVEAWVASAFELPPYLGGAVAGRGQQLVEVVHRTLTARVGQLDAAVAEEIARLNEAPETRAASRERILTSLGALDQLQDEADRLHAAQGYWKERMQVALLFGIIVLTALAWVTWSKPLAVVISTLAVILGALHFELGTSVTGSPPGPRLDLPGGSSPTGGQLLESVSAWVLLPPTSIVL